MSEEDVRNLHVAPAEVAAAQLTGGRRSMVELARSEALRLLAGVSLGRIVFTNNALPAIRPVNHVLTDGRIVILTHPGAVLVPQSEGRVSWWPTRLTRSTRTPTWVGRWWSPGSPGWPPTAQIARYKDLLAPWVDREMSDAVLISLEMVTGYRLVAAGHETSDGHVPHGARPDTSG